MAKSKPRKEDRMSEYFETPPFIVAVHNLFERYKNSEGKEGGYGVKAVWKRDEVRGNDLWKKMLAATDEQCRNHFKKSYAQLQKMQKEVGTDHKLPPYSALRDKYLDYLGDDYVFFNLNSKQHKPAVVSIDPRVPVIEDEFITQGKNTVCRAMIEIRGYNVGGNKGVSWRLVHVQKLEEIDLLISGTRPPPPVSNFFNDSVSDLPADYTPPQTLEQEIYAEDDEIPF